MYEFVISSGPVMWIIIGSSIIALAIIAERIWQLQKSHVIPQHLVAQVWHWERKNQLDSERIKAMRNSSPLGRVLASGLSNRNQARDVMKESIEETGRHVVHDLERYLTTLGTIATITPLLGLLGTVMGMIDVFDKLVQTQDISRLSIGINQALHTTAAGLFVAIPAVTMYRYFRAKVDELVVYMEQEAIKLVEVIHSKQVPAAPQGGGAK
ncbi:MotA/TolQ/ExbB proton channel family protein [hydrothermal vent metagenome]|uniref:MotA/TolQ/ExbB proton channel family protein n=1 Tax=hydrothermal vent metagenome TaxID=652676 RepID=A0A3B0YFR3_9ZZZZ